MLAIADEVVAAEAAAADVVVVAHAADPDPAAKTDTRGIAPGIGLDQGPDPGIGPDLGPVAVILDQSPEIEDQNSNGFDN